MNIRRKSNRVSRSLAWRSRQFVAPYRTTVGGIVGLALVVSALGVADPLLMKYLFDGLTGRRESVLLTSIVGLLILEVSRMSIRRPTTAFR